MTSGRLALRCARGESASGGVALQHHVHESDEVAVLERRDEIGGPEGRRIGHQPCAGPSDQRLHLGAVEHLDIVTPAHEFADHPQHGDEDGRRPGH